MSKKLCKDEQLTLVEDVVFQHSPPLACWVRSCGRSAGSTSLDAYHSRYKLEHNFVRRIYYSTPQKVALCVSKGKQFLRSSIETFVAVYVSMSTLLR